MNITHEKRMEVYSSLPEDIRRLYSSEEAASLNGELIKKYSIPKELVDVFLDVTGDVILGFYKIGDLPRLLQQKLNLSADESQRLTSQLIEFLTPVIKREEAELNSKKQEVAQLASAFAQRAPERTAEPSAVSGTEIVEPIRTMQEDMNRVHGYGAYRAQQEEAEKQSSVTPPPEETKKEEPLSGV